MVAFQRIMHGFLVYGHVLLSIIKWPPSKKENMVIIMLYVMNIIKHSMYCISYAQCVAEYAHGVHMIKVVLSYSVSLCPCLVRHVIN